MAEAPFSIPGAEQATTTKKRGKRGNGRRLRRRLAAELAKRSAILIEDQAAPQPFEVLSKRLERVDYAVAQLQWETRIGWTGEPGRGPRFDLNPEAFRQFERWRGLLDGRRVGGTRPSSMDSARDQDHGWTDERGTYHPEPAR